MDENINSDKSQISVLLNAYSIQEINAIFGEIDEKIHSLHACSSEDFLTLNAYFKKYFSDSKKISNNASELFNLVTKEENRIGFFQHLKVFQTNLQDLYNSYEKFIADIIHSTENMIQEMDMMFVTANNLKQDLMTLKLLVTNLRLDVTIAASPTSKIGRKTNDFNELIIQTKSFFIEFYKYSTQLKESMKSVNNQLIQQKSRNLQHINDILNEVNDATSLLDSKYNEALQLIPKLSENTKNTSDSIAKIITNLQYQDIIRQKIDHIQNTHKDILEQLGQIKESDNEEVNIKNRIKCFIQIRDIAGLQAAQLIHANKEYQKAIENISGKFIEVGSDMTEIADLCNQLIGNNTSSASHFDEIREKLEKTDFFTEGFQKSLTFIKEKTGSLHGQLQVVLDNYDELSDFFRTIFRSINKSLDNQTSAEIEEFESTTSQIRSSLAEIQSINSLYQAQFEKIKEFFTNSLHHNSVSNPIEIVENKLKLFTTQCTQLIANLYESNENVYKIIADNQSLSKKISQDIKTSIEQIKYYDYFDKVIEEIIAKLNEINFKLTHSNIDDSSTDESRLKHLEYLKSRYTMESEHIIHDHLSKNDLDIYRLSSTSVDEDDDNLELFY
jgi:hypothetical protein